MTFIARLTRTIKRIGSFRRGVSRVPSSARTQLFLESLEDRYLPATSLVVGPNVDIAQPSVAGNQAETTIAIDPTDATASRLFAASNDTGGMFARYSTDGGVHWSVSDLTGLPKSCCDAQAAFDQFGNLFVTYLSTNGFKAVVAWSGDGGAHFAGFVIVDNGADQPSIATGPGGSFAAGSVWVSYFRGGNSGIMASGAAVSGRIGQGGTIGEFSKPQQAPGSIKPSGSFGDIAVGPQGEVIVTYQNPASSKSSGPSTIYVNRDLDGLGSGGFGPAIVATTTLVQSYTPIPAQPDRQIDAEANLAWDLNTGRIYLVYTDRPSLTSADTNIYVRYSDDEGATWTSPVLINDDVGGASQFNPAIAVDQSTGNVAVTWYDCRNSSGNNTAQIFGTISTTGGASWLPNVQIGAGLSNGVSAGTFNFGDFDTMGFTNGVFYRSWSDNSTSLDQDPFTARVQVNP